MRLDEIISSAIIADIDGNIIEAALLYEEATKNCGCPANVYSNLSFIYWQVTEIGFAAYYHLTDDYVKYSGERYESLLEHGLRYFPNNSELGFWRMYFHWYWFNDDIIEECIKLVKTCMVPYFFLYSMSHGEQYLKEAMLLKLNCETEKTIKTKYIISIVESTCNKRKKGI